MLVKLNKAVDFTNIIQARKFYKVALHFRCVLFKKKMMCRKNDLKILLKLTTGVQLSSASHLQHPPIILGSEFQLPARFINSLFGKYSLEGSPTATRQRWCFGSKQFLLCQKNGIFGNLIINIKWNNFVKANIYQWHWPSVHFEYTFFYKNKSCWNES
jgi:hypothetical protein